MSMEEEPCYVISIAARILGLHAQTLRYYERLGVIQPSRTRGNLRLYSMRDIDRLRQVKTLINDLGVNLAGVEVILRLTDRMREMKEEMERMESEIKRLKEAGL